MEPTTSDKIEISQQQTRNWILVGVCAFLMLLVQGLYTFAINSTGTELRETNRSLVELLGTVKVHQAQLDYQSAEIKDLKLSRKDAESTHKAMDARLNSLEQREALHDQWIQAHNQ
jgi:uncharacterized coiled-coil protein SlyX